MTTPEELDKLANDYAITVCDLKQDIPDCTRQNREDFKAGYRAGYFKNFNELNNTKTLLRVRCEQIRVLEANAIEREKTNTMISTEMVQLVNENKRLQAALYKIVGGETGCMLYQFPTCVKTARLALGLEDEDKSE